MADSSFLSFATLEKLSGWAGEQATILWRVLSEGPAAFVRTLPAGGANRIGPAFRFLAFVVVVCFAVSTPLVFVFFGVNVFDYRIALTLGLPMVLAIALFTGTAHLSAVALRGRGDLLETASGLFYGAAYLPFVYALHYLMMTDAGFRDWFRAGDETAPLPVSATLVAGMVLSLVLMIYAGVKLAGVIRLVHGIGWIRSGLAVLVAGAVYQAYEALIWMPFVARVIAMKG